MFRLYVTAIIRLHNSERFLVGDWAYALFLEM